MSLEEQNDVVIGIGMTDNLIYYYFFFKLIFDKLKKILVRDTLEW